MKVTKTFVFLIGIGIITADIQEDTEVSRSTGLGDIKGLRTLVPGTKDKYVEQFRKIPYAIPPVRNLRFQKPQPFGNWKGTLDATEFGPSCMQGDSAFFADVPNKGRSEDCLFLNIYVPSDVSSDERLSVMVWIHGGAFLYGQGMFYNASNLASVGRVIVVTLNYRLGIFGFLTLNDPVAGGNYGIMDQILALQWVKENIFSFGGDPDSITIFGESAGGMSTSLLSLIPSNRGLFHRVISQSGTSNSPALMVENSYFMSELVGTTAGCTSSSNNKEFFLNCMKNLPAEIIQGTFEKIMSSHTELSMALGFGPVVDGDLFPDEPVRLLSDAYPNRHYFFRSLDLMAGSTSGEGSLLFIQMSNPRLQSRFNYNVSEGLSKDVLCNIVAPSLVKAHFKNNPDVVNLICDEYSVHPSKGLSAQSIRTTDVHGDFFLTAPTIDTANIHSEKNGISHTFVYMLSRINPVHIGPPSPTWFTRSVHADELMYLFGLQNYDGISQEDLELSRTMMTYWANFARYGNVNDAEEKSVPVWPLYNTDHKLYIDFDSEIAVKNSPAAQAHQFWYKKVPNYVKSENHSHDPSEL
ncbi:carboxylesterase 5A-like [Saccostrea cucullata]|uniref:carboxylesterase 5A-like n=1 Tax=Saccostrea cuccullata TaxID=36930 RepID=UPI002ED383D8